MGDPWETMIFEWGDSGEEDIIKFEWGWGLASLRRLGYVFPIAPSFKFLN